MRLASQSHDADDLEQSAWLETLERPPRHTQGIRSWLSSKVRFIAISRATREQRRTDREGFLRERTEPCTPDEIVLQRDVVARIEAVLGELDDRYATVLRMRYYSDLPPREIATRLAIPVETVYTRLKRGIASMRTRLDSEFGERQVWNAALLACLAQWPSRRTIATAGSSLAGGALAGKWLWLLAGCALLGWIYRPALGARDPLPDTPRTFVSGVTKESGGGSELDGGRAAVPVPELAPRSGSLRVHVAAAEDGRPIEGLSVRLVSTEATPLSGARRRTAADGQAAWPELRSGTWEVIPDRGDAQWIEIEPGQEASLDVRVAAGRSLIVQAQDPEGLSLEGVSVLASDPERGEGWRTVGVTDEGGKLELHGMDPRAWIAGELESHRPSIGKLVASVESGGPLRLELRPGLNQRGRVVDEHGRPVRGATVEIMQDLVTRLSYGRGGVGMPSWGDRRTRTDEQGWWELRGVQKRSRDLRIFAAGYSEAIERALPEVLAGREIRTTLRAEVGSSTATFLDGRVLGVDGRAPEGAFVRVRESVGVSRNPLLAFSPLDGLLTTRVATDGSFRLETAGRSRYDIYVLEGEDLGARPLAFAFGVRPGESLTLTETSAPPSRIAGRLLLPEPMLDALILESTALAAPRRLAVDPLTGTFEALGLAEGEYRLIALTEGRMGLVRPRFSLAAGASLHLGNVELPGVGEVVLQVRWDEALDVSRVIAKCFGNFGVEVDARLQVPPSSPFVQGGRIHIESLAAGDREIQVRGEDIAAEVVPIFVAPGETSFAEVTLARGYEQPFEVRAAEGALGSLHVEVVDHRGLVVVRGGVDTWASASSSAFYLAPGPYLMRVTRSGEVIREQPFHVEPTRNDPVLLHLEGPR